MKNGPFTVSRRVLPVVAILALSGCSDLDVFGLFEDDPQVAQNASSRICGIEQTPSRRMPRIQVHRLSLPFPLARRPALTVSAIAWWKV